MLTYSILFIVLALVDLYVTTRMCRRFGTTIEQNPVCRWAMNRFGVVVGASLGIFIPTLSILLLSLLLSLDQFLPFLCGVRFMFALLQIHTHPYLFRPPFRIQ